MVEPTVKELRTETGMGQKEFADYFGVNVRTLQGWEQGKRMQDGMLSMMQRILKLEQELEEKECKLRIAEAKLKNRTAAK